MKKFFSLMCAVLMVLSASASSARILGQSKQVEALEDMKTVKSFPVMPVTSLQQAAFATAFRAPQAKQDADPIEIEEYTEKFYTTDHDVWVRLYDAIGNSYLFDIVVDSAVQELELNKTYTFDDMIAKYSYATIDSIKTPYATASLTKSISMYDKQKLVNFDAAFTDTLGNSYTLVYKQAPVIPTGDTINVFFNEPMSKPVYADGLCQMRTVNDSMRVAFCFTAEEGAPAGTYTEEDMNLQYTFVDSLEAKVANCVVTQENNHIELEGYILAADGNVYHVKMFFDVPTAQTYETITCTNLSIDDSYASYFGILIASASNEKYAVGMYLSTSQYVGTFDASAVSLSIKDTAAIALYSGTVTVKYSNGAFTITGTALSMDGVEYTLDLSYVKPEPTSYETLTLNGQFIQESSYWYYVGTSGKKGMIIYGSGKVKAGKYTAADAFAKYGYVVKLVGTDTLYYTMVDVDATIAINGTTGTITGKFLGQNSTNAADVIEFTLNLTGTTGNPYDAKDQAFKYMFDTYEVNTQYVAQYGVIIVSAQDAENHYISLQFNVAKTATLLPVGTYTINGSGTVGTINAGSLDTDQGQIIGSFAGNKNSEGKIAIPLWLLVEGEVTVYEGGQIGVKATNTWGAQIGCLLGKWPEAIENNEAAEIVTKRLVNGQLIIEKNGVQYNALGVSLK